MIKNFDLINYIKLAKDGNNEAKNALYSKYYFFIVKIVSKFYNFINDSNNNFKDLLQEASYAFFLSIQNFNTTSQTNFNSYTYKIIKNYLINYLKKNEKINQYLKSNFNFLEIEKIISEEIKEEDIIFSEELYNKIENIFSFDFTNLERKVFLHYLNFQSYNEISKLINEEKKTIDNALYRAKNKLISKLSETEKSFLLNQRGLIVALKNILEKIEQKK
ncbi:MAG: sigma-70 family RNA polymerase sigma factor [Spirochaetes bacterium]|nr:sigma-70 family RNA polymerase sigma factor [Spirochaetota bacterium]